MKQFVYLFKAYLFFAVCLVLSPVAQAEPISWADKDFDFKTVHSIYLQELDLKKVSLGSHVLELNVCDQLKESAKLAKLDIVSDVPFVYQTDAVVIVSIDKYSQETIHIPEHTSMVFIDRPAWPYYPWHHYWYYPVAVPVYEPATDIQCQIVKLHCMIKTGDNNRTVYEYEDVRQVNIENPQKSFKKMFNEMFKRIKKITH